MSAEKERLQETKRGKVLWRKWGTVREDYSPEGTAWDYMTHNMARSKAYRWGEEEVAGISDDLQFLCFSLALWNGRDPILKERLFGLTGSKGNHGDDVKECYYHSARGKIAFFLWQTSGIICGNHLDEKPSIYPLARELYDSHRLDSGRNRSTPLRTLSPSSSEDAAENGSPLAQEPGVTPINKSPV